MVLGLDVAKNKTGWAYMDEKNVWHYGVMDVYDPNVIEVFEAAEHCCHIAAIEKPWLHPDPYKRNPKTLIELALACGRAQVFAQQYGMRPIMVPAQQWKSSWGLPHNRKESKYACVKLARMLTGADKLTNDEADAILLCEYSRRVETLNEWR